ncbi:hypothetical protein GBA52_028388 [Prunus armeniaca]|nr:hypothetical protein GBA52_028388 [Prunus armeniaca]
MFKHQKGGGEVETVPESDQMVLIISPFKEIWNGPYSNDSFPVYAEDIDAGWVAMYLLQQPCCLRFLERLKITYCWRIYSRAFWGSVVQYFLCLFGTDWEAV